MPSNETPIISAPAASIAPAPAAAPAPVAAPVEAAPAPVSAPVVSPAPAADAAPIAAPVAVDPVVEAKPEAKAEVKLDIAKPATSLLAEAVEEQKKPEVKAEAEATEKPVEPAEAVEIPLPTFESFAVPEGIKLDDKEVGRFTSVLGELENATKGDHRLFQETGQKLLDMYIAEKKRDVEATMKNWVDTRKGWVGEIKDDPILGRNRFETNLRDAARVRDMFATKRFSDMIEYTGAGDHPGMMDFVYNIGKFLEKHGLLREGTPVAAPPSRAPAGKRGPRSRYQPQQGA